MARHWRIRYAGAKYHLTARGNGRDVVFLERDDYERFLEQLTVAMEKDEVVLYAYVLMPNHYHLFVETPLGNVQRFMQRLNTAYSMYFRFKHSRPGHCFQGRYGAKLVDGDDYLLRLTRYIHLNPIKTRQFRDAAVDEKRAHMNAYLWSSYRSYAGLAVKEDWINYRWLKLMGRMTEKGRQEAYRKYIEQMMGAEDVVLGEAMGRSVYAIGDAKFIETTEEDIKAAKFSKIDTGDIVWPEKPRESAKEVLPSVLDELGLFGEELKQHGLLVGEKKAMAIELLCQLSSSSQREISRYCGYKSETVVGRQRATLRRRLAEDPTLKKRFETAKRKVRECLNASY